MDPALYKAAMEGDVNFLREVRYQEIETGCWNKQFLDSVTPQENNIIHVASQYDQYGFLKSGFDYLYFSPLMIAKRNANGDTPLHVASKRGNKKIVELLVAASNQSEFCEVRISKERTREISEAAEVEGGDSDKEIPWMIINKEGNTPLHEALIYGKLDVATYLLEVDPHLGNVVNNAGETPLHLAIKYNVDGDKKLAIDTIELLNKQRASLPYRGARLAKESLSIIELLLQEHNEDVYLRDNEGLTPLLRAAVQSHFTAIEIILNKNPDCLEMCDLEGKTVMHLIKFQTYEETKNFLCKNPQILNLRDQQDKKGNTPAHIAVMNCIEKYSNARKVLEDRECGVVMKFQSYEEATKFTKMPQLLSLKGEQDNGEDTSASPVVMNCMVNMKEKHNFFIQRDIVGVVRALFELSTNFNIKNKEGVSAATLFQQLKAHFEFSCVEPQLKLDAEIDDLIFEQKFKRKEEKLFWKAVEEANVSLLRQELVKLESCLKQRLLSITDLFHKLLNACKIKQSDEPGDLMKSFFCNKRKNVKRQHDNAKANDRYKDVEQLMKELFEKNPMLIYETNSQGDTPLHLMAREQDLRVSESLLDRMKQYYESANQQEVYCPPWRVKNVEGNTPLHEALLHIAPNNDGRIIKFLFKCEPDIFQKSGLDDAVGCDFDIAAYLNNRNETPLHVFCESKEKFADEDLIKDIIKANEWASTHRDVEGFTPLLRAAQQGKIDIVKQMLEIISESAEIRDYKGQTFWHVMDMSNTTKKEEKELKEKLDAKEKIKDLASAEDYEGTTPLLQAINSHNFNLAQVLSSITMKNTYEVINEKGIGTRYTLFVLLFANFLPQKLEAALWTKMKNIGVKSFYGIPKTEINNYTNTLGVIAVLLATIAFTAAFAVPGGFDQNKGYPLLLKDQEDEEYVEQVIRIGAYWVFMVADILTMCLSMLVLFCIQWIITGDEKDKLVITDLSLMLLTSAFRTTIVALMMGVFASTCYASMSMAIFTVVMCSTVLMLLRKDIIINGLQYVFLTYYLLVELCRSSNLSLKQKRA